jgi:hypothetical protein
MNTEERKADDFEEEPPTFREPWRTRTDPPPPPKKEDELS